MVNIRNIFTKLFSYIPKEIAVACIQYGKSTLLKQLFTQKSIKENFVAWFTKYLAEFKVENDQVKDLNDMLRFMDAHLKSKQIENVDSYREILLRRQLELAFSIQNR
jgi:hypothetical protein